MRHRGSARLAALGAICAGALALAAGPASAVTLSLGGSQAGATLSVGDGPLAAVDVHAPGSTEIAVEAAPSGTEATVNTPLTPPLHVAVTAPALSPKLPIVSSDPAPTPAAGSAPTTDVSAPTPSPSVTPSNPVPGSAGPSVAAAPAKSAPVAINTSHDARVATATRAINSIHHNSVHAPGTDVTASIASSSDTSILSAMRSVDAQLALWIALAALVIAMRLFAGSATSKAARAG